MKEIRFVMWHLPETYIFTLFIFARFCSFRHFLLFLVMLQVINFC